MRVLIAPLELKGTLSAFEAAEAMADGVRRAWPDAACVLLPMADGGPGTADALVSALGGQWHVARVHDALGRARDARWGTWGEGIAGVLEMAAASGLSVLAPGERDARRASTRGTGELIRAAVSAGTRALLVGLGGSATNDGGAGALQALGVRLLDGHGRELPPGGAALLDLARVDLGTRLPALRNVRMTLVTDVTNPLLGPSGASAVYGPQKGATVEDVALLDRALHHFADVVRRDVGLDVAAEAGMGAAGGLAYGLAVGCGATVTRGFARIAEVLHLDERLAGCDVVLTSEGRLDAQTLHGKGPFELAVRARAAGKNVFIFAGSVVGTWEPGGSAFDGVTQISPPDWDAARPDARQLAAEMLAGAVEQWARARGVLR